MTPAAIVVRSAARRDIGSHYRWLAEQAGFDTADRFLDAIDAAFHVLAEHPHLGPTLTTANRHLTQLRKWKVAGFPNVLIFYEPRGAGISIVRVVHAEQDYWRLIETAL